MTLTKIDDRGLKTPIDLLDNEKIRLGTGNDLQIYHDGSNSYITEGGTGDLYIQGSAIILEATNGENYFKGLANGAVQVYYDGVSKLQTTSIGITVTDKAQIQGSSGDTELILKRNNTAGSNGNAFGSIKFTDSSNNNIGRISTIRSTAADDGDIRFETRPTGGSLTERLRIKSTGNVQIPADDKKLQIGAGQDLSIVHDGNNSVIENSTGNFVLRGDTFWVTDKTNNHGMINANRDGSVDLYYDNSKKLGTKSDGVDITGELQCDSLDVDGTATFTPGNGAFVNFFGANSHAAWDYSNSRFTLDDNTKLNFGTGQDLELYHNGSHSRILDAGTGKLQLGSDTAVQITNGSFNESIAKFKPNEAVELYYDNSKRFETTSTGVTVTGDFTCTAQPAFYAKNSAGDQDIGSTDTVVSFNSEQFDRTNSYNPSNSTFTAPAAGVYYFTFGCCLTGVVNNFTYFFVRPMINGSDQQLEAMMPRSNGGSHPGMTGSFVFNLSANDTVRLEARAPAVSGSVGARIRSDQRWFAGYKIF